MEPSNTLPPPGRAPPGSRPGLEGVVALARARFGEPLTLAALAAAAGMPTNTLTRLFNRRFGLSPMRWLWGLRVAIAAELIAAAPDRALADVARRCGFTSSAHFSRRFRDGTGTCPSLARTGQRAAAGAPRNASEGADEGAAIAQGLARLSSRRPRRTGGDGA